MLTQISGYNVRWCGNHVRFEDHVDPVEDHVECAICLNSIGEVNCCTTECGHIFCLACLIKHSKGDPSVKCPLCRQKVTDSEPVVAESEPVATSTTYGLNRVELARDLLVALANNPRSSRGVQVSRDLRSRAIEYTRSSMDMEWGF